LKPREQHDQVSIIQQNDTPKQKINNKNTALRHEVGLAKSNPGIKKNADGANRFKPPSVKSAFSFSKKLPDITDDTKAANVLPAENKKEIVPEAVAKNTSTGNMLNAFPPASEAHQPTTLLLNSAADTAKPAEIPRDSGIIALGADRGTPPNKPEKSKLSTIAQKKHQWFLTFSAGTTQTVSSVAFNTGGTTANLASANLLYSIPAITSLNLYNSYNNISRPKIGFHVSAGALYERSLSPHWKISGGLSFSYVTNTQQTGAVYKNPLYVAGANYGSNVFSLTSPLVTLQSYYQAGSSFTVTNKAWQAEIPIGVSFVFNPKSKTTFMLNAGVSYAWLFSSQWLIPDARYGKLYYSKAVFNNTSFNWQAGPAIQFKNQWRFGLQYQQSFTSVAKAYVTPSLHWQNIGVYTAIPLGRKKGTGKRRGMDLW
jgi:hypothetical protein